MPCATSGLRRGGRAAGVGSACSAWGGEAAWGAHSTNSAGLPASAVAAAAAAAAAVGAAAAAARAVGPSTAGPAGDCPIPACPPSPAAAVIACRRRLHSLRGWGMRAAAAGAVASATAAAAAVAAAAAPVAASGAAGTAASGCAAAAVALVLAGMLAEVCCFRPPLRSLAAVVAGLPLPRSLRGGRCSCCWRAGAVPPPATGGAGTAAGRCLPTFASPRRVCSRGGGGGGGGWGSPAGDPRNCGCRPAAAGRGGEGDGEPKQACVGATSTVTPCPSTARLAMRPPAIALGTATSSWPWPSRTEASLISQAPASIPPCCRPAKKPARASSGVSPARAVQQTRSSSVSLIGPSLPALPRPPGARAIGVLQPYATGAGGLKGTG